MAGVEAKAKVGVDQGKLAADLSDARSKLERFGDEKADAKAGLDKDEFDSILDKAKADLDGFDGKEAKPELGLKDEDFKAKLDDDAGRLDDEDGKKRSPELGLDDEEFKAKLDEDEARFSLFGSSVLKGLMPGFNPVLDIGSLVAAGLPGISAGVAGLSLLGGTGALAFGGIAKALSAHSQAAQNVGVTGAQMAATEFANAVAVQQAEQAIQQAKQQSAQDAKASAMQIVQANQQVGLSEQQLRDAQFQEQQAQVNLTQARIQARLTLQQLNDAEKDSVLNVRAAKLALAEAEYRQQQTDQNAMSTQLDKEQAALAVAQAQRQVIEAQQTQVNSAQAAQRANKLGVDGSQQVVQAQHAVVDAVNAVKDAEMALRDGRRTAAFTAEQAAFQARRDAQAVANAEQNLTNLIREQRLQWAATMSTSNSAANQFARDMTRLTPAARHLVYELLTMHGAVKGLETTAQKTIAPGLSVFLRGLLGIMPEVRRGVAGMGRAVGQSFAQFGHLMGTDAFRTGLAGLIRNGIQFSNIVLPALARFLQMLGLVGSKRGAALGVANLLAGLVHGLTGLIRGLTPAIPGIDKFFSILGRGLAKAGPLLGRIVGDMATVLAPAAQTIAQAILDLGKPLDIVIKALGTGLAPALAALLPGWKELALTTGHALVTVLRALGPALLPIAKAMSDWMIAQAPAVPLVAQFAAQIITDLVPDLNALLPLFVTLAQILPPVFQGLQPLIKPAADFALTMTQLLVPGMDKAIAGFVKLIDINLRFAANVIKTVEDVKSWWTEFTGWATSHWDSFFNGLRDSFRTGVHDLGLLWHAIEPALKNPVNFLITTVYDNGIRRLWDDIVSVTGLGSLKLPVIPAMARGGIVPGVDRGRDTALVAMRPDEGVLVPEAVRGLGGPGFVHAANALFGRGGSGGGERLPNGLLGFGKGGVLGWIDRGISDVGRILLGGLKDIPGLITHPAGTVTHLLDRVVGTPAKGGLGQVLTALPKILISDLAKSFAADSPAGGLSPGSRGDLSGSPLGKAMVRYAESFIGKVPYLWGGTTPAGWDCSGMVYDVYRHFGFNPPRTSEAQWGWVQRTPHPVLGGLAFFAGSPVDPPPGHVGVVTGSDQIANAYGTGFGTRYNAIYGSAGQVFGFGVPPGSGMAVKGGGKLGSSFDSGGWLMPAGMPGSVGVNHTGRPEAVLTPEESAAFVAIARRILADERTGSTERSIVNNFTYVGTQHPTPEQKANMMRELALTLS